MTNWTCHGFFCDAPEVVFALYGDGLVAYRQASDGQATQAQLSQSEIDQLLAFAIGQGGMRDTESENAFSALSGVHFSIWSEELTRDLIILTPLERLLQSPYPSHQAIRDLAQRLVDFETEMGDRAQAFAACAVTPAESLPPEGASAVWQSAGGGIWMTAPDWYGISTHDLLTLGLPSAARDLELRWWLPDRGDETLAVRVERMSEGVGGGLVLDFNVWPDAGAVDNSERTVALPQLPPGCYDISIEIGGDTGHLVERVRL